MFHVVCFISGLLVCFRKQDTGRSSKQRYLHNKANTKNRTSINNCSNNKKQQQQNHHLRTDSRLEPVKADSSLSQWGLKCISLVPTIRLRFYCCLNTMLGYLACMQCIITEEQFNQKKKSMIKQRKWLMTRR